MNLFKLFTAKPQDWMEFGALFEGEGGSQGGGDGGQGGQAGAGDQGAGAGGMFQELATKKGLGSPDDLAKIYIDGEKEMGRRQSVIDSVKTQLEAGGYEMDNTGKIQKKPDQGGQFQQPYPQQGQQGQQQYYPQQQQQTYDAYGNPINAQPQQDQIFDLNGMPITNQLDRQLAMMPVSQRTAYVTNALMDQREKQQTSSFKNEQDVLNTPEAKGFEADVRNVMMQVPLAQRADKKMWDDALLRVKGMRYEQAMKNAGQDGVNQFLNKDQIQGAGGQGAGQGGAGGAQMTQTQRDGYKYYQLNYPGMFKDEAHYLSRC